MRLEGISRSRLLYLAAVTLAFLAYNVWLFTVGPDDAGHVKVAFAAAAVFIAACWLYVGVRHVRR